MWLGKSKIERIWRIQKLPFVNWFEICWGISFNCKAVIYHYINIYHCSNESLWFSQKSLNYWNIWPQGYLKQWGTTWKRFLGLTKFFFHFHLQIQSSHLYLYFLNLLLSMQANLLEGGPIFHFLEYLVTKVSCYSDVPK